MRPQEYVLTKTCLNCAHRARPVAMDVGLACNVHQDMPPEPFFATTEGHAQRAEAWHVWKEQSKVEPNGVCERHMLV